MSAKITASYFTIRHGEKIRRTVQIGPGLLVDLDTNLRVCGIENIGGPVGWSQLVDVIRALPLSSKPTFDREAGQEARG